jgi:hypothetical protein
VSAVGWQLDQTHAVAAKRPFLAAIRNRQMKCGQMIDSTAGVAARMEGLMATVVALDASPSNVLRLLRGPIVAAHIAYPDVLHVEVRDSKGNLWRLATQDAEFSPSDPSQLLERSIEAAHIDEGSGELRCGLSDGSVLDIKPATIKKDGDPPYWELISPAGMVLEFGPGVRWQISSVDAAASSRPKESLAP